jgi:hypothetical protein
MTSYRSFVSLIVTKIVFEIYVTFQRCPVGRVTRLGDFSSIGLLLEASNCKKDIVVQRNVNILGYFLSKLIT